MAKNFLIPIDMNSMEIMNFAVHNVSTLPTAVNGRLVYHDGVLKFGYTANRTTQWATLLDDARLNMADYKKWSETVSYLSTNYYDKTSVDNLLTGYSKTGHTQPSSTITDWAERWETSFGESSAVAERLAQFANQKLVRVYHNPQTVSLPPLQETMNSTNTTGGTICFNVQTGHILYKVGTTYYNGSFPDEERSSELRSPSEGDIVILEAGDVYVSYGFNTFVKITSASEIDDLYEEIGNLDAKVSQTYVKNTDYSTWKTGVDNTLGILTGDSDTDGTINKWKELETFMNGFTDSESASLKEQLDAKVAKGPKSSTSGFASATSYTPTLYGSMTTTSKSGKAYRRLTVDANGDLTSEMYKFVIEFTVGSANTATYVQMQAATFLNALGTTAGTNGFQEVIVQVYKTVNGSCYEIAIDVRQDQAGVVLTWGTAPTDGTYRVIVTR